MEAAYERETFAEPVRELLWFKDFCPKMVASAVEVLEGIIKEMRIDENSSGEFRFIAQLGVNICEEKGRRQF